MRERPSLAARAVPFLLLASTAAKSVKPAVKKEPPPVLNPFFESLLKWWCEAMDNEADSRCNLLFTHRHISQTNDGTQIRGLSAQMRRYVPMSGAAQRDQFAQLAADFCKTTEAKKEYSCKRPDPWLQPVLRGAAAYKNPNPHAAAPITYKSKSTPARAPDLATATALTAKPATVATSAAANTTANDHDLGHVNLLPKLSPSQQDAALRAGAANASSPTQAHAGMV